MFTTKAPVENLPDMPAIERILLCHITHEVLSVYMIKSVTVGNLRQAFFQFYVTWYAKDGSYSHKLVYLKLT